MKVALYARVSTHDQQTLPMQLDTMRTYAEQRQWTIVREVQEIGSGISERKKRNELLKTARKRTIDVILVWKLDRWGRSLEDLVVTLKELSELGVGFVSLTEALDFTTATGRALAGLLAVFAEFERNILSERIKAGIAQRKKQGKSHGRPKIASEKRKEVKNLFGNGISKSEIARKLDIGRTSVRRILTQKFDVP